MTTSSYRFLVPIAALLVASPSAVSASPLDFDCDVPANRYSSVSQEVTGQMSIGGMVEAVELRSGKNLPVAGARLASADGRSGAGFQLIADSARAKSFDIVLNTKVGDDVRSRTVGRIGSSGKIPFRLTIAEAGTVTLTVGANVFTADLVPTSSGVEMAFCSTGQFKFSALTYAADAR